MKALELHGICDLRLADQPEPTPGPDDLLLRVTAVGVCGSDIHYYAEGAIGDARIKPGFVLGHEFAGEVVELGQNISKRDFSVGDIIAADPAISCGHCEFCERGDPNFCLNLRFAGQPPDSGGALQQFLPWPAKACFKLPEGVSAAAGAMMEPLGVGLHAARLGKVDFGDTVVIIGCGPIGLSVLQFMRLTGAARIIMLDKLAYRLKVARDMGADDTLLVTDPKDGDHVETVREWTKGGAHVVFEAAGDLDAMADAVDLARRGGRVVWVGIPGDSGQHFNTHWARRHGLTMKMTRRMKLTYPPIIELSQRGKFDPEAMITHTFTLEQGPVAFSLVHEYADEVIKAIIEPEMPS